MKKTIFLIIILLICSYVFAQDARYIDLYILGDAPVYDEVYPCKLYFNMHYTQDELYIVKFAEMSQYDIAYITNEEMDYFDEWSGVNYIEYGQEIQVGIYDEVNDIVIPIPYSMYSDYDLGSGYCEGTLHGFYQGQISCGEGNGYISNSSCYIEVTPNLVPPWDTYEYYNLNLSSSGWNWVSFPVLDPDYDDPVDYVLEPILDDLDEVRYKDSYITWTIGGWQNQIGDFSSVEGYKIQMDDNAELEVAGWHVDLDTEISLYEEENWIGYFIPYSQAPSVAFGEVWQYVNCIQGEDWSMYKKNGIWYGPAGATMDYGKGYVVWVDDDCTLEWVCFGQMESFVKLETQYFSYEEKASYEAIDISGIDESISEIGVFENDICVGASVVENGFAQILAYTDIVNKEGSELTFQVVTGKGHKQEICNIFVYDFDKNTYIKKKLMSGSQKYSLVRLNEGEENQTHIELSLSQNIPNPFFSNTLISYSIPKESHVKISVYNLKGQKVKTIVNEIMAAGNYSTVWSGTDDKGNNLPNGVYFYKLDNDNTSISKKVIIMH